ncbi:hypothetical protein [Pseudomonas sp. GL-B-19]|uniref:hypothetical protein n=1 Tax=Pseudomonas sp. GL-B-19 TaxID=2832393 RepID=UPI001CBCB1F5|nr:hypothetical protein [Pseudomonas sp. GL-B-19]
MAQCYRMLGLQMLDKIGHIKNPLTVIAMFAGIAEVSGTVVLPFLDVSIQGRYVWFLMSFPCFLVALFFLMLWKKHHVLYAPSDFKEDKSFMDANFNRHGEFLSVDVSTLYPDMSAIPVSDKNEAGAQNDEQVVEAPLREEPSQELPKEPVDKVIDSVGETTSPVEARQSKVSPRKTLGDIIKEDFSRKSKVVRDLAYLLGGRFEINVEPKQLPNIRFDAVIESSSICVVSFVEVSADRPAFIDEVEDKFADAKKFWDTLNDEDKSRFVFHLALMFGPSSKTVNAVSMKDVVASRTRLPFKTEVALYEYDEARMTKYVVVG